MDQEPIVVTHLTALAAAAHETFVAFTEAGFTEEQGLTMVIAMLTSTQEG